MALLRNWKSSGTLWTKATNLEVSELSILRPLRQVMHEQWPTRLYKYVVSDREENIIVYCGFSNAEERAALDTLVWFHPCTSKPIDVYGTAFKVLL